MIDDAVLLEAVAKQGGYEEVENEQAWGAIAKVLGQRKTDASKLKQRYEEMLLATADAEKEDEDEEAQIIGREHEVEDILDDRIEAGEKQAAACACAACATAAALPAATATLGPCKTALAAASSHRRLSCCRLLSPPPPLAAASLAAASSRRRLRSGGLSDGCLDGAPLVAVRSTWSSGGTSRASSRTPPPGSLSTTSALPQPGHTAPGTAGEPSRNSRNLPH